MPVEPEPRKVLLVPLVQLHRYRALDQALGQTLVADFLVLVHVRERMLLPLAQKLLAPDSLEHELHVALKPTASLQLANEVHDGAVPSGGDEDVLRAPVHGHQPRLCLERGGVHGESIEGDGLAMEELGAQRHPPRADGSREGVPHKREPEEGFQLFLRHHCMAEPEAKHVVCTLPLVALGPAERAPEELMQR
eukprot:3940726-Rhodomonas_salina.2